MKKSSPRVDVSQVRVTLTLGDLEYNVQRISTGTRLDQSTAFGLNPDQNGQNKR